MGGYLHAVGFVAAVPHHVCGADSPGLTLHGSGVGAATRALDDRGRRHLPDMLVPAFALDPAATAGPYGFVVVLPGGFELTAIRLGRLGN